MSDLLDGARPVASEGPDGKTGILIGWPNPRANKMHFDPDLQEWEPAQPDGDLAEGRYWIGFWNDSPPTQRELLRSQVVRGSLVALGNGEQWLAPDLEKLPADAIMLNGRWLMQVQPRFSEVYVEHQEWRRKTVSNEEFLFEDLINFALMVYQINYRIPREFVSKFRLFDSKNLIRSLFAFQGIEPEGAE
ncbi:MAG TPA: hypothetical protein VLA12_18975 [Planctomycetaceae bacterium]|nr:hypothetical protein [Planctomycetaceae bacterium]